MKSEEKVFIIRRKKFARIVNTAAIVILVWTFGLSVEAESYGTDTLSGAAVVPLVMGLFIFVLSTLRFSCIRITEYGIAVENIFIRHSISWGNVRRIDSQGGLRIVLNNGDEVGSIQFGGSLIGEIGGYRTYRPYVEEMRSHMKFFKREGMESAVSEYSRDFFFPLRSVLVGTGAFLFLWVAELVS